jgi:hypothetical protein
MGDGSARPPVPNGDGTGFVRLLDVWIQRHGVLLDALVELRELGGNEEAVAAVLAVKLVRVLALSWQIWDQLTLDDGRDPDELLGRRLSRETVERARFALTGRHHRPKLRVV